MKVQAKYVHKENLMYHFILRYQVILPLGHSLNLPLVGFCWFTLDNSYVHVFKDMLQMRKIIFFLFKRHT